MKLKARYHYGFTLLEVLLASVIALLLLAALYASFDVVIAHSDIGRSEVEQNDLSRAVVNRVQIDLTGTCGPLPPLSGGNVEAAIAGAASTDQSGSSTETTDPNSTNTGTGTETASDTGSDTTVATSGGNIPFSAGLIGNSSVMTVFVSRVPNALVNKELSQTGQLSPTDIRKITYYIGAQGLCRQERPLVTADGVWNNADADRSDEAGDLLAEEITFAQFQYFSGTSWVDSWDGTQLATDGKTLLGPPRAVKINFTVEKSGSEARRFSHTFALRSANGLLVPTIDTSDSGTAP